MTWITHLVKEAPYTKESRSKGYGISQAQVVMLTHIVSMMFKHMPLAAQQKVMSEFKFGDENE